MIDGPGDYDSTVYLPDRTGSEPTCYPASWYAPVSDLPDPADMASWKYCCPDGEYGDE